MNTLNKSPVIRPFEGFNERNVFSCFDRSSAVTTHVLDAKFNQKQKSQNNNY